MQVKSREWASPGLIFYKNQTRSVFVPEVLLCMNLIKWAHIRVDSLRVDAGDTDYPKTDRRIWKNRADSIQQWLDAKRGKIPASANAMLSHRSEYLPWVVSSDLLDAYIESALLVNAEPFIGNNEPRFLLWSDENRKILYLSDVKIPRILTECTSDFEVTKVTQDQLYAEIGRLSAAQVALSLADALKKRGDGFH